MQLEQLVRQVFMAIPLAWEIYKHSSCYHELDSNHDLETLQNSLPISNTFTTATKCYLLLLKKREIQEGE